MRGREKRKIEEAMIEDKGDRERAEEVEEMKIERRGKEERADEERK